MECSIRQPPPACGGVGPPLRRVGALNGEVLVVAEHRRHRCTQRSALHEVPQLPEDRRAAQHQPALAGDAGGADRLDERGGTRRGRRRAASRRRRLGLPPGPRPPRPGAPTSACRPRWRRSAGLLRPRRQRPRRVATQDVGEAAGTALALVVDRHDRGVDDAAVNHGLDAQAMGPGNETGPDKSDAQHAWTLGGGPRAVSSSTGWRRSKSYPVIGSATTRPASASMKRDATMTSRAISWRSRRLMDAGRPPQTV